MSEQARQDTQRTARSAPETDTTPQALRRPSRLGWWLLLVAAIVLPIVIVLVLAGDGPLLSPFVYRM